MRGHVVIGRIAQLSTVGCLTLAAANGIAEEIPYSLKFSRLKNFADYGCTTKILSREMFTYIQAQYDLWAWPFCPCVRARSTAIDAIACMLVPTGCRYGR